MDGMGRIVEMAASEMSVGGSGPVDLRAVHRAAADLRRGIPVLIARPDGDLAVLSAETADASGFAELQAVAAGDVVLLLSRVRAGAILGHDLPEQPGPVAVRVALGVRADPPDLQALRGLTDPTLQATVHARAAPMPDLLDDVPDGAEAAIGLAKLAHLLPAVLAATLARDADRTRLLSVTEADIASYPQATVQGLARTAAARVPLADAPDTRVLSFRGPDGGAEHLAILVGDPQSIGTTPLVRIHSECFTGDLLGSLRCDCGPQLHRALRRMSEERAGVLLYLAQEGRGIGLTNKLRAYALQDGGLDTLDANTALGWDADERDFSVAAAMLRDLRIPRVRLLTNNPRKIAALESGGIEVERVAHVVAGNGVDDVYLATKASRFGHLLGMAD